MNYQRVYSQIIDRARIQNRTKGAGTYYESHHLVPKCVGGSNSKDNRVLLTAREHFICHWLLHNIYPESSKLAHAFWMMCNVEDSNQQRYKPSNRTYAYAKEVYSKIVSAKFAGKPTWNTGLKTGPHADETKRKIAEGLKKYKRTPEHSKAISKSLKGRKCPPRTAEHSQRLSESQKGNQKGAKKVKHLETGVIYDSVTKAAIALNCSPRKIRDLIKNSTLEYYKKVAN